jgi:division protein CdvB (Snf7/Vps24/ESCRT-III family)
MSIELTANEKIKIINSHLQSIAMNEYNLEINIMEEQAKSNPNATLINNYQSQILDINNQSSRLQQEIDSLQSANTTVSNLASN